MDAICSKWEEWKRKKKNKKKTKNIPSTGNITEEKSPSFFC
jgi:hypothetical protein